MGKKGKERAKERREKRLQEISELRKKPILTGNRWWSSETVAVVTGANRGIGFEIARQLAAYGLHVIMASRDAERGRQVAEMLQNEGLSVNSHQLDISNQASVESFSKWVVLNYGAIDILVNNAGVNFNLGSENSVEFAEKVIETNYVGTKRVIKAMIPVMRPSENGARILNVSSRLGRVNGRRNRLGDANLREKLLTDESLSEELIDGMVAEFLKQVKDATWMPNGWPQMFTDYSVSKLAVNAYTRLMAKLLSSRPEGHRIYINCYCPGWVKTAMTGWQGNMSAEEGADTGVWIVLLPNQLPTGNFFAERREISF
ncbi:carbonyl reductase [NADPH] 1-like isoform X2 [Phalaenopsis equestris]|uniref:carbonyl reductase [NADPH] 1-like isoform X2 n=1 Tax=Phalaenopsis equestris TaxID=78828 RepID=UPI0009E51CEC|nr:carbonyl reductase [NADPH] 1-like isoform X2 [Phalaenopsis equestris]